MHKKYWYFLFGLVALVLFVEYDLTKRSAHQPGQARFAKTNVSTEVDAEVSTDRVVQVDSNDTFIDKLNTISSEVGFLQASPEDSEKRIQSLAAKLTAQDLNSLSHVITDKKSGGDKRALAVELLSRHQSVEALRKLEEFVQDHDDSGTWSREREFESVLRSQAVEGIAAFSQKDVAITSLTKLDPKISESFLKDRIKRNVANLKNQAPSPTIQDEDALRKLIE